MTNQTLLKILNSREDISEYLFHFTKGAFAIDTLNSIVNDQAIKDIKNKGVICFTEAPIIMLDEMFYLFEEYQEPMFARYGIAVKKSDLYELGARPVIYGSNDERDSLPCDLRWRFEQYIPNVRDFSWLREWRIKANELPLDNSLDFFVITKTKAELISFAFDTEDIGDIEIDGDVEDGSEFHGYAYTTIPRKYKGVSFEDIRELNLLSKHQMNILLKNQNSSDTEKMSLGGF